MGPGVVIIVDGQCYDSPLRAMAHAMSGSVEQVLLDCCSTIVRSTKDMMDDFAKALAEHHFELPDIEPEIADVHIFRNIIRNIFCFSAKTKTSYFNNCASGSAKGGGRYPRYPVGFVWTVPRRAGHAPIAQSTLRVR